MGNSAHKFSAFLENSVPGNPAHRFSARTTNFICFVTKGNNFMQRLFALVLVIGFWFNFAPPASASAQANLVPCSESPAFLQRAKDARNTTSDPSSGAKRFERYAQAQCGPEGLPHLIVDGRLDRAGDFLIPSILFLYIAGWIGWAGRSYLRAIRKLDGSPEMKEIVIDVPLALQCSIGGATWPLAATSEFLSGELYAKDEEIPVSPR
jgi:photosystem I subunit 3